MIPRFFALVAAFSLLPAGFTSAELESRLDRSLLRIATDHSSPEQIGPIIHHHHHGGEADHFEFEVSAGADSRYVSEGRDNLPGEGGIFWCNAVGHLHALGGSFYGEILGLQAWEADYQEVNLATGYEFELGSLTVGAGVTWLWFPEEDEDDLEIVLAADWALEGALGFAVEAVWSTEAEGWFGEAQLYYEQALGERLTLIPSAIVGTNQGYVTDEHDGFNHLTFQLEAAISLAEHLTLHSYAAFVEPLQDEAGESLRDLFWVGAALTVAF